MNILRSTALYGNIFQATDRLDVYSLRVYTGGFASVNTAENRARKEAEQFVENSDYSDYEISDSKRVWFPFSCVDFLITFHTHADKEIAESGRGE